LKFFLDTNVLVYSVGADPKSSSAKALVIEGPVISVQVLNEFINVARRRLRLSWDQIDEALSDFGELIPLVMPLTLETHRLGAHIARKHGLHIYDSMIVASAALAGCGALYTEDLQHGQVIEGVKIVNPFL
jgi:predicted nucleic acid-binding protein